MANSKTLLVCQDYLFLRMVPQVDPSGVPQSKEVPPPLPPSYLGKMGQSPSPPAQAITGGAVPCSASGNPNVANNNNNNP